MLHINDLPEDHLVQILDCLGIKTRAVAELVCKQWKDLIEERVQPINFKLTTHSGEDSIEYHCRDSRHTIKETIRLDTFKKVALFFNKHYRATAVCIETASADNLAKCLKILSEYFSFCNLEHLELKCLFGILSIEQLGNIGHIGFTRLRHLSVCQGARIDTRFIKQLFESCSHLETLFLNCSCILHLKELTILPPSLKSLFIPKIYVSQNDLKAFVAGDGKQLEEIQLMAGETGHLRTICGAMNGLRTLIIPRLTIVSANDIRLLKNLRYLETLKIRLTISGIDVNDAMLEVLEHCPRIQQLDLTLCYIRDNVLTQIPRLCPNMKDVCLYNYNDDTPSGITDQTLETLTTLKNLRKLCIISTEFTATGLMDFLMKCPTICYLHVNKVAGDICPVVAEMIRRGTKNPTIKYEMMYHAYDVSYVRNRANLNRFINFP